MAGPLDAVYNVFFKRSTTYIPLLFVGAYFTNQVIDYGVEAYWGAKNRGKSFQEMIAAREASA